MNNTDIRVVLIQRVKKHPQASKLQICEVSDGVETFQVVCGAANAAQGMKTILAPIGSITPSGVEIKLATLREVESYGMLCSAKDLNISDETGIVHIPKNIPTGQKYDEIDIEYLSSIPWHSYKEVEAFWLSLSDRKIAIDRTKMKFDKNKFKLISKTYFHEDKYYYRNFN